jgi:hypothetical protein
MAKFMIPTAEADAPVGSGASSGPFPEGTWKGRIEVVRINDVFIGGGGPEFVLYNKKSEPPVAQRAEVASIQLGGITPVLDGQDEVGNRKFFDELLILSMDEHLWDEPSEEEPSWKLEQTRRRLTNLAVAVGAAETDGNGSTGPVDDFGEMLRASAEEGEGISGCDVIFEVYHERFTRKGGEGGVREHIRAYLPA